MDEATSSLDAFLAAVPVKCPGCKSAIHHAVRDECPECGEALKLEVVSLRQARWSDRGAIPVNLALGIAAWCAICLTMLAGLMWAGPFALIPGPTMTLPSGYRMTLAGLSVASAAAIGMMLSLWVKRRALLRARLRVRIAVLVVTSTMVAACMLVAWLSMRT